MDLEQFFNTHPKVAIGFSGGVDSSYLLYAAKQYGGDIKPYFVKTAFQPEFELQDAKRLCEELSIELTVIRLNALENPDVVMNDERRCYYCKTGIFTELKKVALADGYEVMIDGNNASDDADDRPGMQAVKELNVYSPLLESGLTKSDIRLLSKEAGLFTWDKPSYACLATRVPTGRAITIEDLEKAEKAEDALFKLGFTDFRVRLMGDSARLQLQEEQMPLLLEKRQNILAELSSFSAVLLDLKPRQ